MISKHKELKKCEVASVMSKQKPFIVSGQERPLGTEH